MIKQRFFTWSGAGQLFLFIFLGYLAFVSTSVESVNQQPIPRLTIQNIAMGTPVPRLLRVASPLPTPPSAAKPGSTTHQEKLSTTYDLLFINEHGLLRWRHKTNDLETIVSTVISSTNPITASWNELDYALSTDQSKLLIAHGQGVIQQWQKNTLLLYDTHQATLTTLLTTTHQIAAIAISPDHQWAAYMVRDVQPPPRRQSWWQTLLGTHRCYCGEGPSIGTIYAMHLQPPYLPQKLRVCGPATDGSGECKGLLGWLFNHQQLLWQDGDGYWAAELEQNHIGLLVKDGQPTIAMNPTRDRLNLNRYLISWIYRYPEVSYGILDASMWRVLELPHQAGQTPHDAPLLWLADNRLLWAKPAVGDVTQRPTIELWTVAANRSNFLTLQQVLQIPGNTSIYPIAADQLADGRIVLAIANADGNSGGSSGLYWLDLEKGLLHKLNDFPKHTSVEITETTDHFGQIKWAPDGAGAIYLRPLPQTSKQQAFYILADGSPSLPLNLLLGNSPEQLTWLSVN